ncbi:MAG: DeoR/GlpR transcriptional regulator, partial [Mesorhizobium sp.]
MLTDQRHQIIRDRLAVEGRVLAGELASHFGVSEDTVRRDLRELAKAGECRRVYGGAVASAPLAAATVGQRGGHAVEEKMRLASAAVRLLSAGQSLFIDGGTTNAAIARAIPRELDLTVATNSLGVASALSDHPQVELIVLGGRFVRELGTCVGAETLAAIAQLGADLCFLGSCGLDAARG